MSHSPSSAPDTLSEPPPTTKSPLRSASTAPPPEPAPAGSDTLLSAPLPAEHSDVELEARIGACVRRIEQLEERVQGLEARAKRAGLSWETAVTALAVALTAGVIYLLLSFLGG